MKYRNLIFAFLISIFFFVSGCASTTPLINASANGDSFAVQKLIKEGAKTNEPDSRGYTPLMHAVWSGNAETVKVLLNHGADVNVKDDKGYTPLLWASSYNYLEIAKLLIDKGSDVNVRGNDNNTPYDWAMQANNGELAKILLNKGADITIKGSDETANTHTDGKNIVSLLDAVPTGNHELVKLLIEKGADVNCRDKYDETPLHYAATLPDFKMVKLLVDMGANINAQSKAGITALHYVAQTDNNDNAVMIAEYLLNKNAVTNLKDEKGWTALRHAIYKQNVNVVAAIRKKTNWEEKIESLSWEEALKSPSFFKPEQDMFEVPADKERAYKIAVTDCNLIVTPFKTGLLIGTGGIGYVAGLAVDSVTIKGKFQNCMAKMGFECKNNCSK